MAGKANAIYITGGGGTPVVSASAYGLMFKTYTHYRDKIGTFLSAVGGMRGAINEDITDVFGWADKDGESSYSRIRLNTLKFPATPVFLTSRHKPDEQDCRRLLNVFAAHNIHYAFLNGGNDSMEKAIILTQYAKDKDYELHTLGIPKTVDNDLLVTDRCPGYASSAKEVAINTMSLEGDLDSFSIPSYATRGGPLREGAIAQVEVLMGRDHGWLAMASIVGKLDESHGPHVILTKEGGFDHDRFLDRCQNSWDNYGKLLVVASEGTHDGEQYVANYLDAASSKFDLKFLYHEDPHKNVSVTDSRLGLLLKLLLENELNIPTEVYKGFKCREEGPGYLNRDNLEIMSLPDFRDAVAVGERAAELAFGNYGPVSGVMVTLKRGVGETDYTPLDTVADPQMGSKAMTKPITDLDKSGRPILSSDGMMINRDAYVQYIGDKIDLNGPNRREVLGREGFRLPLEPIRWKLEERKLPPYRKISR
jgi:6-phosphofructokinase